MDGLRLAATIIVGCTTIETQNGELDAAHTAPDGCVDHHFKSDRLAALRTLVAFEATSSTRAGRSPASAQDGAFIRRFVVFFSRCRVGSPTDQGGFPQSASAIGRMRRLGAGHTIAGVINRTERTA